MRAGVISMWVSIPVLLYFVLFCVYSCMLPTLYKVYNMDVLEVTYAVCHLWILAICAVKKKSNTGAQNAAGEQKRSVSYKYIK